MRPHIEDVREANVEARVVKRRQRAANEDEHEEGHGVDARPEDAGEGPNREEVEVLAGDVLEGVGVDRVLVAAEGAHLAVVVLVHEGVNRLPVEEPVEEGVRQVINDEEEGEVDRPPCDGAEDVANVQIAHHPRVLGGHELNAVVHKKDRHELREGDADLILGAELLERLHLVGQAPRDGRADGGDNYEIVKVEAEINGGAEEEGAGVGHFI